MDQPVLVELHQPKDPLGAVGLVVFESGRVHVTGLPGGEQSFRVPEPTRRRIETEVASVPWQQLPEVIGDLTFREDVLRAGGREVRVGVSSVRDVPPGIFGVLAELSWILLAARYPDLLHATRNAQFSGDTRWMNLRVMPDGTVHLGTIKGSAEGRLEDDELGRLRGILEGMRFTDLDVRDPGYFDWELVHGFNRVILENDTMDPGFVPLLQLCGEIELRLLRDMPPPAAAGP